MKAYTLDKWYATIRVLRFRRMTAKLETSKNGPSAFDFHFTVNVGKRRFKLDTGHEMEF